MAGTNRRHANVGNKKRSTTNIKTEHDVDFLKYMFFIKHNAYMHIQAQMGKSFKHRLLSNHEDNFKKYYNKIHSFRPWHSICLTISVILAQAKPLPRPYCFFP